MLALTIDGADLLLAALVVGALFGAWLFLDPAGLDAGAYVTLQQQAIRKMNTVMPALGAATILVTIAAAVLRRQDRPSLWLLVAAAICFAAIGWITRFQNQPINAIVMTWRHDLLPPDWTVLRDCWWRWHCIRVGTGVVGLSLLIVAMLRRSCSA